MCVPRLSKVGEGVLDLLIGNEKVTDGRTDGRTDGQTDGQTDRQSTSNKELANAVYAHRFTALYTCPIF